MTTKSLTQQHHHNHHYYYSGIITALVTQLVLLLITEPSHRWSVNAVRYVAPEDCEWRASADAGTGGGSGSAGDSVQLTCKLRTINGAFDSTNFSLIQAQHTAGLHILCDDILFESSLSNRSFEHLTQLRELNIDRCKLPELPLLTFAGLSQLRNLTVRSNNLQWGDLQLKIPTGGLLTPVPRVQRIDLSTNAISWLPESLFCGLQELQFVNLTGNLFQEVVSVGFSSKNRDRVQLQCKLDSINQLDMSYNRIKVLTDRCFGLLSRLQMLSLHHNQISRAEEGSLAGLSGLTILDMSANQLVALPPKFFQSVSTSLTELYLQNNSISVLPPGLFNQLGQMVLLDLSHNEITTHWINTDTFSDLIRLIQLDLSHNRLSRIDAQTFRNQYSLEVLQLHHNEIETIADNAFQSLYNLHTLVLSHNRLQRIDSLSLSGLHVLNMLALDSNKLDFIHGTAFKNITNLMELNVSSNRLESVPTAITNLQFLRSLDLSYNRINDIANASYRSNEQLYGLNLEANQIGNLSKGVFQDLPSLRILNLAKNKIQGIEQGSFDDVPDLHALRLDSNYIVDINGLFSNLRDLLMLNISVNKIGWFDYALIPIGLQWLDIHENQIDSLGNYFELESVLKLRTLDASVNRIGEIDASSLPNGIESVLLNSNLIKRIAPFTFMEKQNLTRTDLTNNKLSTLDINAFRLSKVPLRRPLPEFSVGGNPYLCDCTMEWLQRVATLDESRQYPRMVDVQQIECQLAFAKQQSTVPLTRANSSQFLCPYKSHCFALCHCCEFDACDCEMTCPDNCTCYYDQTWSTNVVDCSAKNYNNIPPRLPMDVTALFMDGNDIYTLTSHTFIGRKNMRHLHLNNSNIHSIGNNTFNGLVNLEVIHLEYNELTQLNGYEFSPLFYLRELYLQHNRINTINNNTFIHLKSLQVLHLEYNMLVEFQVSTFSTFNTRLTGLYVANNRWSCECRYMEQFQQWVINYSTGMLQDTREIRCYNSTGTLGTSIWDVNATSCANQTSADLIYSGLGHNEKAAGAGVSFLPSALSNDYLIIIIVIMCIIFLMFILCCVYRKELKVWIYSKYGVRLFQRTRYTPETEKLFDAFVSYCKKDESFIAQILAPELECGPPPYRLCLRYRDLPMSVYMAEAITEAIECSHRTVILLSEHFLKSEWCLFELKAAHREAQVNKNHRVVAVLLDKYNMTDLDADTRLCLQSVPIVQWGERRFWEKLRYLMPPARTGHQLKPMNYGPDVRPSLEFMRTMNTKILSSSFVSNLNVVSNVLTVFSLLDLSLKRKHTHGLSQ
ncbi:toll-like receptor 6 [Oppia nitens]|uniref:toll-like receptor 6 n=1 Tax=Oppia nitens TaxID=1686743 RepID=UPI0023DA9278|nr:toll-like receptor 6 [Oppia nitens]